MNRFCCSHFPFINFYFLFDNKFLVSEEVVLLASPVKVIFPRFLGRELGRSGKGGGGSVAVPPTFDSCSTPNLKQAD